MITSIASYHIIESCIVCCFKKIYLNLTTPYALSYGLLKSNSTYLHMGICNFYLYKGTIMFLRIC